MSPGGRAVANVDDPPPRRTNGFYGSRQLAARPTSDTQQIKKMHPSRGVARPGRGDDVDLEALQDAFLRSAEKPSAKVTRSRVCASCCRNQFFESVLPVRLRYSSSYTDAGC